MQAPRRRREFDVADGREQLLEEQPEAEPGEVGAEAEVLADAERELQVRRALDPEAVRIVENGRVTVRRRRTT